MEAINLLTQQHRAVDKLFDRIQAASPEDQFAILEEIAHALTIHTGIEERIFYPAVRNPETEDTLEQAAEDHLEAKRILADMLDADPEAEDLFGEPLHSLIDDVQRHVQMEETELFPKVRASFDARTLAELGERMGELAAARLTDRIIGAPLAPTRIITETALTVRKSSGSGRAA